MPETSSGRAPQDARSRAGGDAGAACRERSSWGRGSTANGRRWQTAYDAETKRIESQRGGRQTTGLVAILARVSGFNVLRRQFDKHHDKRRHERLVERLRGARRTAGAGAAGSAAAARGAKPRSRSPASRPRAGGSARAASRSKPTVVKRTARASRGRAAAATACRRLTLELKPPGRRDAAFKARNRHGSRVALEEKTPPAPPQTTAIHARRLYARRWRQRRGWKRRERVQRLGRRQAAARSRRAARPETPAQARAGSRAIGTVIVSIRATRPVMSDDLVKEEACEDSRGERRRRWKQHGECRFAIPDLIPCVASEPKEPPCPTTRHLTRLPP